MTAPPEEGPRTGPLTVAQRAMLTAHRVRPGDPSTNTPLLFEITGAADAARLRAAVERVLRSARALNVTFEGSGSQARYREFPVEPGCVGSVRVPGPVDEVRSRIVEHVAKLVDTPFPPERGPLYTISVWEADDRVFLTGVFSHLIYDVATMWLVMELIGVAYDRPEEYDSAAPGFADLGAQPSDVLGRVPAAPGAVERVGRLLSAASGADSGPLAVPRRADGSLPGTIMITDLGAGLRTRIETVVAELGVSPFAFFLGAHLVLLSRFVGGARVAASVPLANRFGKAARRTLGMFMNVLPMGVELDPGESFADLCRRLGEETLDLLRYQGVGAAEVRGAASEPAGGLSGLAADTAFTYYRRPVELVLEGCRARRIDVIRGFARYPLSLAVEHTPDRITLMMDVCAQLTGSRPIDPYQHILEQVSADPHRALREIALLDGQSVREVRSALNAGRPGAGDGDGEGVGDGDGDSGDSLDATDVRVLLAEAAARHPDARAVVTASTELTYGALAESSDRVAAWVASNLPAGQVAVAGPRGADLVVATLGILKAGKAFVPVDPEAPASRLAAVTGHFARLPLVAVGDALPDWSAGRRVELETLLAADTQDAQRPEGAAVPQAAPDDSAYIVFTSGTTGTPKGVEISHATLARHFAAARAAYAPRASDVWCLLHAPTFDMAIWEMLAPLVTGGTVAIADETVARSPAELAGFVADRGVTVLTMTPTAFAQVLPELGRRRDRVAVRYLFLGGEALRFGVLREWFALRGSRCRVFNQYGPTETTIWVTHHEVTARSVQAEGASVIGRPHPHVRAYVVDQHGHQLPPGVPGELLIGGGCLAKGYFGAAGLTAKAFVSDRYGGERVYRTGDRVVQRPDGLLAYEGRRDGQVQLRGYRVELGEVESALHAVPGVRDAAVRVHDPDGGRPRLVAYVVTDSTEPAPLGDSDLRKALRDRLPAYMTPSLFVHLPALPLTRHGKVDDAALPGPAAAAADQAPASRSAARVASRREALLLVVEIWREAIGVGGFGPDDNFFEIGGTSLHVAEVHARLVESVEGLELDMIELFEHTTPAGLAARIAGADAAPGAAEARRRRKSSRRRGSR